jgi:hypothetical protein
MEWLSVAYYACEINENPSLDTKFIMGWIQTLT